MVLENYKSAVRSGGVCYIYGESRRSRISTSCRLMPLSCKPLGGTTLSFGDKSSHTPARWGVRCGVCASPGGPTPPRRTRLLSERLTGAPR